MKQIYRNLVYKHCRMLCLRCYIFPIKMNEERKSSLINIAIIKEGAYLDYIPNSILIQIYEEALQNQVDQVFITLIEGELMKRGLLSEPHNHK